MKDGLRKPGVLQAFLSEPNPQEIAETLVAFANTDGGVLVIGMDAEGRAVGVDPAEVEDALRQALLRCRPPVPSRWEQGEADGRTIVLLYVSRSPELHSLDDGRVLIRRGAENRPLEGREIQQLAATKSVGEYELELVPGATRADLNEEIIREYLSKREARQRRPVAGTLEELLIEMGALSPDGQPTVAGILLFGKHPQRFLPHSGLVFVKYSGITPHGEGGLPGYARREEISGPLARIIEQAWKVVWDEMQIGAVVRGLEREERPEYPPFAVREAIVNAVCHRDYRLRGRRIEIRKFADRLEVSSPGGLPGHITLDNIVDEHYSRNPRIVSGLFYWGYIEELGLGIDRMIEEMIRAGHPPPKFIAQPYSFTVILYNRQEHAPLRTGAPPMNERQLKALQYIREHGRITNREYQQLCPGVSPETLRLDLADLVHRGILLKIGEKRGTYYILK
ncbi:MAG: ATP-binding protein [Anaerolineae bacterium]|nr:putative DNA binding domain-containing protein [Thermoflexus sp.]MDW8064842.1 ATP-binding protein [Anaerolineae bacterium]